jgi:hypothetical protein
MADDLVLQILRFTSHFRRAHVAGKRSVAACLRLAASTYADAAAAAHHQQLLKLFDHDLHTCLPSEYQYQCSYEALRIANRPFCRAQASMLTKHSVG